MKLAPGDRPAGLVMLSAVLLPRRRLPIVMGGILLALCAISIIQDWWLSCRKSAAD